MSDRALQAAAARAAVSVIDYLKRIQDGERYCYRCRDWHDAGEFGTDSRRLGGTATSCLRSVRAARQTALRRELGGLVTQPSVPHQRCPPPEPSGGQ